MEISLANEALKKYFGYDRFRPMQAEIIQHIYAGEDVLVLMPTGGGKSLCYQIPAITLPGTAIVVSPLISLMKDQVESLRANGVRAAFLNSSLDAADQYMVEEDFFQGKLDLLYVSPEKLLSQQFLPLLQKVNINLFAIDEAHCISSWGHDFRPEYTQMRFLKRSFPNVPVIALTATADKVTRKDILSQLQLPQAAVFIASFDRPNLSLEVRPGQKKLQQIAQYLRQRPGHAGIIYCLSRKGTEDVAERLKDAGFSTRCYHAGLSEQLRSKAQEDFINDNVQVICATVAFGMGIDKSNVRWVIHYNLPKNIESFYQEIGRSGRDGVQADTLLFYSYGDVMILDEIIRKNESEQVDINLAKLERMREYAESAACRRRLLLSYFGEDVRHDCGNCDNCKNPPTRFDGTVLAQKTLSALARLKEKVGMLLLIDVLRGSGRKEVLEKGYDKIKTYGAGRDLPQSEWQHYIRQLIQLGYLEIAHDEHNVLKLTAASQRVLFEKEKVELVRFATVKERQEKAVKKVDEKIKPLRLRDELFEHLRKLRRQLSQERGIPPYMIFSDATLEEMAAAKPANSEQLMAISGVGEQKLQQFGQPFLDAIQAFLSENIESPTSSTYELSFELLQKGISVEEVAARRKLSPDTIYSHLAILYEKGEKIDIHRFVSASDIERVTQCLRYLQEPYKLKDIYEYLQQEVPYPQIRLALAHKNRAQK